MTGCKPNDQPRPHLNTTTLGVRAATCELGRGEGGEGGGGHKHSAHSSQALAGCPLCLSHLFILPNSPGIGASQASSLNFRERLRHQQRPPWARATLRTLRQEFVSVFSLSCQRAGRAHKGFGTQNSGI